MSLMDFIISLTKVVVIIAMILCSVPLLAWMERKGAAYIQDRRGPNRARFLFLRMGGLFHSMADALKLLMKEEVMPSGAHRQMFVLAPAIALFLAMATAAVVPFAAPMKAFGSDLYFQIADPRSGLIYVFAITSLGAHAILLAGWSSNNKYSLIGGLRSASQLISYELAMGAAAMAIFMLAGSFRLSEIIGDQGCMIWNWNAIRQPAAFIIFFAAFMAETGRLPFDLPESEAEIVAGYHLEYSSMRFAMFFMAEYAHMFVGSIIVAAVFLGGWEIPFVPTELIRANTPEILLFGGPLVGACLIVAGGIVAGRFERVYGDSRDYETIFWGAVLGIFGISMVAIGLAAGMFNIPRWVPDALTFVLQIAMLLAKGLAICVLFIWIRWTLPRFRYDQVMRLGWKVLLPLAMINLVVTGAIMMYTRG